jgi:RNA polymerase sigma-70 factor, ECF subfamily
MNSSTNNAVCRPDTAPGIGATFDEVVLPHLDAARRLARWLMRNEHDAEDVVQEASLRALRYFRTFTGGNGRAWFLRIVRNTCVGWHSHGAQAPTEPFDEELHSVDRSGSDPETLALQTDDAQVLEGAMRHLPERMRELLMRRELEGLSYRELAAVMNMPMGSVMSGLSRARQALRGRLGRPRRGGIVMSTISARRTAPARDRGSRTSPAPGAPAPAAPDRTGRHGAERSRAAGPRARASVAIQ